MYSTSQLQTDLAALTKAYQQSDPAPVQTISREIDQKIGTLYTKAEFLLDADRALNQLCHVELKACGSTVLAMGSQYQELARARAQKHLSENYLTGAFRLNAADYSNPKYRPDYSKAAQPSPSAFGDFAYFRARQTLAAIPSRPVETIALAALAYYAPTTTLLGATAYVGYRAYQNLGN